MTETSMVKRIHKWKPFTGRPADRPKYRWEDDVRNGVKKMKRVKWTEQYMAALNGRILLGRQRLVQSCGAIEKKKNRSYT